MSTITKSEIEFFEESNHELNGVLKKQILFDLIDHEDHSIHVWNGFRHFWRRKFLGYHIPHRIQAIRNYITHQDQTKDYHEIITMGQNNVVDGNFMKPEGFYTQIQLEKTRYQAGRISLCWFDASTDDDHPKARSRIRMKVKIPKTVFPKPVSNDDMMTILLNGFDLSSTASTKLENDQNRYKPKGFWPYRLFFKVADISHDDSSIEFILKVDVFRAWTPNRGGLPYLDEKPYAKSLRINLDLYFLILIDRSGNMYLKSERIQSLGRIRDKQPKQIEISYDQSNEYKSFFTGINSFGFEFSPINTNHSKHNHLGRYIGGIWFQIKDEKDQKSPYSKISSQVWSPQTVINTDVRYLTEITSIYQKEEIKHEGGSRQACICINSDDNAKFFSTWKRCGKRNICDRGTTRVIPLDKLFEK